MNYHKITKGYTSWSGVHKCQHNFIHFFNSEDALCWIEENPIEDMFILLKGSRGIKLEMLKEVL